MSYILDALRKADAQRERDSSRGIHAHPAPFGSQSAQGARAPWLWGAMALAVVVIAGAAWYFSRGKVDAPAPAPTPAVASPAPVQQPVPAAVTVAAAPAPQPAPAAVIEPPPPAAEVVPPPPPGPSAQVDAPILRPNMPAPTPGQMPMPAPAAPAVVNTAPAAPAPAVTGLPADAPRIAISGGVYSTSPAQRMLIVNGQVLSEGSEAAPGVTIAEIKPRTAVLKFRGALYTVAY